MATLMPSEQLKVLGSKMYEVHKLKNPFMRGIALRSGLKFLGAETNTTGDKVYLTFSKAMADPAGKQSQFSISI